jgi:hypothetical protein
VLAQKRLLAVEADGQKAPAALGDPEQPER